MFFFNQDRYRFSLPSLGGFILLAILGLSGCDAADDPSGGDTEGVGDTDFDPNGGDGRFVRCCFFVSNDDNDGRAGCVPTSSAFHPCVNPTDPIIDTNGSGDVTTDEFAAFCQRKVPDNISFFDQWMFGLLPEDEQSYLDINGPWVSATGIGGSFVGNACVPDLSPTTDYPAVTLPTHEGTFTSQAPHSSSANVQLDGATRLIAADGRFSLALSDCQHVRHLQTCHVELQALELDLQGPVAFTNYSLDTALLSLQDLAATSVTFDCSDGVRCVGAFDFSTRTGTSLDVLLHWDQTNLVSGSLGGGSLRLGRDGLASMSRVLGELDLDLTKASGTLRLRGGGSDSLGGDFASIDFDIAGKISTFTVP